MEDATLIKTTLGNEPMEVGMEICRIPPRLDSDHRPRDSPFGQTHTKELFNGIPCAQAKLP